MNKFNTRVKCLKCGNTEASILYHESECLSFGTVCAGRDKGEHMVRNCYNCNYKWVETHWNMEKEMFYEES